MMGWLTAPPIVRQSSHTIRCNAEAMARCIGGKCARSGKADANDATGLEVCLRKTNPNRSEVGDWRFPLPNHSPRALSRLCVECKLSFPVSIVDPPAAHPRNCPASRVVLVVGGSRSGRSIESWDDDE